MLLLVAVFRTSEIDSQKCESSCADCVQIWHLLSLNKETMPHYRVLPPLLDKVQAASSGKLKTAQPSIRKMWLVPGLITCFTCLVLGLFFLI